MADALVGIGSNIEPERWLPYAARKFLARFRRLLFSHLYRSPAVGMDAPPFVNACVRILDAPPLDALKAELRAWEAEAGRNEAMRGFRPRTLDLDVLAYDGEMLGSDLKRYAHAWLPARDVWPEMAIPPPSLAGVERIAPWPGWPVAGALRRSTIPAVPRGGEEAR